MSRLEILALFAVVLAIFTIVFAQSAPAWIAAALSIGATDFDNAPQQEGLATIESVAIQREGQEGSGVIPKIYVRFNGYIYQVPRANDWMSFRPGAKVKVSYRASHSGQIQVDSIAPY